MDSAAGERARLLDRARVQYRAGDVADAWRTCAELAELSRVYFRSAQRTIRARKKGFRISRSGTNPPATPMAE